MYDVSVFMPAIRTPNWDYMYDTIEKSCKKHSFELVMCGPFELTEYLKSKSNVKMIIDNGSPSRCAQRAAIESSGRLLAHCVDDSHFIEDALDKAIFLYDAVCGKKDVVNLRYTEDPNRAGKTFPNSYWFAHNHEPLKLPGVPEHYKQCCHHMVDREYFLEMGGYDCQFEYQNLNLHDLIFRIQYDGGKVYDSKTDISNDHMYVERSGDHGPIMDALQYHDMPLFTDLYSQPDILKHRGKIPIDNWKQQPSVWKRRFGDKVPDTYEEVLNKGGK